MKDDVSKSFRLKSLVRIIYSAIVTIVIMAAVVLNLGLFSQYIANSGVNSILPVIGRKMMLLIILLVGLGIAIFTAILFNLQNKALKYVSGISEAVKNMSEGDLEINLEIKDEDEFAEIASNLNKMAEEIRKLMDKERATEKSKNELITNVAHDLRTPLTSILGYLELLESTPNIDAKVRENYIEIALIKSKRLRMLIDDLFGLTKMSHGKLSMEVGKLDIVKLLDQMLEEFYPTFSSAGLSYELRSNVNSKIIIADGNLIARLFENLINNAVKYGAEGKKVIVEVDVEGDNVVVDVINYGHIIPEKELDMIFDRFYRVEQSRASTTGGTGLGLAIVKNIVEIHGGNISVTSDFISGTIFKVKLKADFDINRENFGGV